MCMLTNLIISMSMQIDYIEYYYRRSPQQFHRPKCGGKPEPGDATELESMAGLSAAVGSMAGPIWRTGKHHAARSTRNFELSY